MINLLIFVLSNSGIAYIVTQSKIFLWLRDLSKKNVWAEDLLKCPICTGWWSSIVPYLIIYNNYDLLNIFIFCNIGSITAYIIFKVIKKL